MPLRDGTGPSGKGPLTGRGAGSCRPAPRKVAVVACPVCKGKPGNTSCKVCKGLGYVRRGYYPQEQGDNRIVRTERRGKAIRESPVPRPFKRMARAMKKLGMKTDLQQNFEALLANIETYESLSQCGGSRKKPKAGSDDDKWGRVDASIEARRKLLVRAGKGRPRNRKYNTEQ